MAVFLRSFTLTNLTSVCPLSHLVLRSNSPCSRYGCNHSLLSEMFIAMFLTLSSFPYYVQNQDLKFLLIITGMFDKMRYFQFNDINLFPTSKLKIPLTSLAGLATLLCFLEINHWNFLFSRVWERTTERMRFLIFSSKESDNLFWIFCVKSFKSFSLTE